MNIHELEQRFQDDFERSHVPGATLVLLQNHHVISTRSFGKTSAEENGVPITPQTLFLLGSISKGLTCTAALRLVEMGKLELDRLVKDYVPWIKFRRSGAENSITVRMLFDHTAGLADIFRVYGRRDADALEASIREDISLYPFTLPPGIFPSYSGVHINLLAFLMEVVTGKPFADVMQELLFDPLEMQHTTFDPTVAMTHAFALGHYLDEEGQPLVIHRFPDNAAFRPSTLGLSCSADLTNFVLLHVHKGAFQGRRLLSAETIQLMHTVPANAAYSLYGSCAGLGFMAEVHKGAYWFGNHGSAGNYWCKLRIEPETGSAIIVLMNCMQLQVFPFVSYFNYLYDFLLDQPESVIQTHGKGKSLLWPTYVGDYVYNEGGIATLQIVEDRLCLRMNGGSWQTLEAVRDDLYDVCDADPPLTVGFLPFKDGQATYIALNASPWTRVVIDVETLNPSLWEKYVGTYSRTADRTYKVTLSEGVISIRNIDAQYEVRCIPLDNTHFASEWGVFEFVVEADGQVQKLIQIDYWMFLRQA